MYQAPRAYQGPPPVSYQVPPAFAPLTASLQIEVTPGETEILVDGARVGMAKEFPGPVTVPVAAGAHALTFRVGGVASIENIVASPQTTVLIKRDFGTAIPPQQ